MIARWRKSLKLSPAASFAWLAVKVVFFLFAMMETTEIIVVAYQKF